MIQENEIALGREFLREIRQSPAVEVKVRGVNRRTGRSVWFARKYVVQDDPCQTALELRFLAEEDGIFPTKYYAKEPTTKPLDPRLINYPEAIFE